MSTLVKDGTFLSQRVISVGLLLQSISSPASFEEMRTGLDYIECGLQGPSGLLLLLFSFVVMNDNNPDWTFF